MSKTRADLINQALINLGILAQGQSAEAENIQKMDAIVDPALAELAGLGIYYTQDAGELGPADGAIEDSAFLSTADYLANRACAAFNLAADTKMQALAQIAEDKLRTLSAPSRTLRTLRTDPALQPRRIGGWYRGGI
jgi:hypothetical protein